MIRRPEYHAVTTISRPDRSGTVEPANTAGGSSKNDDQPAVFFLSQLIVAPKMQSPGIWRDQGSAGDSLSGGASGKSYQHKHMIPEAPPLSRIACQGDEDNGKIHSRR
jgi:hypothetical protein